MSKTFYSAMVKVAKTPSAHISPNWVTAKRTRLRVFSDRIEWSGISIPYSNIKDTVMFKHKGIFSSYILKFQHDGQFFYLGLAPNRFWRDQVFFKMDWEELPSDRTKRIVSFSFYLLLIFLFTMTVRICSG